MLVSLFYIMFNFNINVIFIAKGGFKLAAFGVKQGGIGSLLAGGFPGLKKTGGAKPEPAPIVAAATAPVAPAETVAAPAIPTVSKPTQEEPTETQKPRSYLYFHHSTILKLTSFFFFFINSWKGYCLAPL